jgi:hypothetical protein
LLKNLLFSAPLWRRRTYAAIDVIDWPGGGRRDFGWRTLARAPVQLDRSAPESTDFSEKSGH